MMICRFRKETRMKEFDVDALSQYIIKSGKNEKLGPEIAYFCGMLLGKIKSGQFHVELEEELNPPIKEKPVDEKPGIFRCCACSYPHKLLMLNGKIERLVGPYDLASDETDQAKPVDENCIGWPLRS